MTSPVASLAPTLAASHDLLQKLLDVSLTGIILLRPVYASAPAELVDFAYVELNPAAQRMLKLPAHPSETFLTRFPHAVETGIFAFYRNAFLANEPRREQFYYQHDGLNNYFHLSAQRSGELLLVSFSDTAEQDRSAVEQALRESQAREQAARAEVEQERQLLQALLTQAPVAIGLFQGEELQVTAANAHMAAMWGRVPEQTLGLPLLEALPELRGQGFDELLRQVQTTRVPVVGTETPATMLRDGELQTTYYNFVYQPLYDTRGEVLGVINVSVEVTEQVRARQEVEQLNRELETRVQERTRQLQQQQHLLSQILGQVPAAIATLTGPEHRFSFVNDLYQSLIGKRAVLGQTVAESLPEVVAQGIIGLLDRVYITGQPFIGQEIALQLYDDTVDELRQRYVNFVYQPLRGTPAGDASMLVFAVDVTDQVVARQQVQQLNEELEARVQERTREAQAARTEAERQRGELQRVFEQAPTAIAVYRGPSYVIELANPTVCRLWGRTQEQIIGRGLFEALPEVAGMGYEELLDGVMATGVPYVAHAMEAVHEREGRRDTVYWDFVYVPMYEADGSIYGAMVVATEVTGQVVARREVEQLNQELETRVQERTRQLELQQSLLRQILSQVPACIATLTGPEHRYTFFNEPYQLLTGNRVVMGAAVAEVLPELVEQGFVALLDKVYATGQPFVGSDRAVLLVDPKTGRSEQRYVDFVYQPLFDKANQPQGILAFIVDVTDKVGARRQVQTLNEELAAINAEMQATNKELNATNARLIRTNTDLDTFVYTASHDLKAPIANIEGLLDTLRDYLPASDTEPMIPRLLEMMQGAVARFQQTVGHLTDVSRLQYGSTQPTEAVDLLALVEDVRLDLAPLVAETQARLQLEIQECPVVYFSPKDLRSIVYNLLSNALKYHAPEREPLVQMRAWCSDSQVLLEVTDNGLGLDEQQQRKLFTLFRRLHNHVEGSGVGLYMVKRIVENAGGTVTVHSEAGVGSSFLIMLPRF